MRRRPTLLALVVGALAVGVAGCSGGDDEAQPPATETGTASGVAVQVVDGDTEAVIGGARVRALGGPSAEVVFADDQGRAGVAAGTRTVRVSADGYAPARAAVRGDAVTVQLYDPELQSPEYGGGPTRTRYLPKVSVPVPDGDPDWSFDTRTLAEFPPAVRNGLVVVGVNSGRVYALDLDTGEVEWARRERGYIASSPAIHGTRVYVTSMDGKITAYRTADGIKTWEFSTGGSPVESSPLLAGDQMVFGAWNGKVYAVDVRTGELDWTFQAGADVKGSAAMAGDAVIVGDYAGRLYALDAQTGRERWRYTGGRKFYGGPAVSGNTIVIGDVGGAVIAVDARSGRQRWRHSTGGAYVYSTAAIARGAAFIGSYNGRFEALDLRTGAVRWSFDAGGRISGSATVVGDVVYTAVLSRPGEPKRTYALDTRTGEVRWQGDDGRYSPAVAAGRTLILVGTHHVYAHHAPGS